MPSFIHLRRVRTRLNFVGLLIAPILVGSCSASLSDHLELGLISRTLLDRRLRAGEVPARERQAVIESLFQQVGCQVEVQKVEKRADNVICNLPGETNAAIVVGGHFDFVDKGEGIVDDWSGASLLISLYQTLKAERLHHTYRFVAFAAEERGLLGSSRYVKELSAEEKDRTQAFVNLECLGLTAPKVWVLRSTPALVQQLTEIARGLHVSLDGVNVDAVGDDDTHPFLLKRIPVISIHSITQETLGILHSNRDNIGAIDPGDYYDAYRLVAFYLKYLDDRLPIDGPMKRPQHSPPINADWKH